MRESGSFGHLEYDRDTLAKNYRDVKQVGLYPDVPKNYFWMGMTLAQSLAFR